ncbi:TlpA disulfide reductase family protein [Rhodoferax sp.]|uniref:TlpA family protein disulfide reductase n=1 Tax=Rhodoferax sp. TaxID=50421 RepID=UPI00284FB0D7|nr:TlpA disulfide reductase family protein [Rhodoferax sp.]MDR3372027.1 TlpA disulfide reductase family protein [Rhodoferax sp.]
MSAQQAGSSRRTWLAAAGVAVVAGGTAYALRSPSGASGERGVVETAFWQQRFGQLDGSMLSMSAFRGKPLVLNFWATWCPPCIAELPLLNAFFLENKAKSWQVVGLAVDQPSSVKRFLVENPLSFPVALAGAAGTDLSRSLGNLSGGLPFTVVFGPEGEIRHRKIGRLSPSDLEALRGMDVA